MVSVKTIVTHTSPDLDAITSVWIVKRFLPEWHDALVEFVPAGQRTKKIKNPNLTEVIEVTPMGEFMHVDTGMGPLDHHQANDLNVCGASRAWDYVKLMLPNKPHDWESKQQAVDRIVKIVVEYDHFKEIYWENPTADYYEFSLYGILEGLKFLKVDSDQYYTEFICECLDALLHNFQNRIWAEKEIEEHGTKFQTKKGKGIGFLSLNDNVVKLAQKMGYAVVIRKDPRKGYVRIKVRPDSGIDLTLAYEKLKKMDPDATWFLHVSKKMLLNGSVKNPEMVSSNLDLDALIQAVEGAV